MGGAAPSIAGADEPVSPPFALEFFIAHTTNDVEVDDTVAGGHPFQNTNAFVFTHSDEGSAEDLKDAYVKLPLGFLGNPAATALGATVGEASIGFNADPPNLELGGGQPVVNVAPDYGSPAQFFFQLAQTPITLQAILHPRTESYAVTVGSRNALKASINGARVSFFGVPAQHGSGGPEIPFLSNPLDCSEAQPTWKLAASTWTHPAAFLPSGLPDLSNPEWVTATETTLPVIGCDNPALASQFSSTTIAVKPLQGPGPAQADSPTGLAVDLDFPQSNDPTEVPPPTFDPSIPQGPEPKDITVKLPAGLAISPSSANGLGVCSDLASDPAGDQVHYDTTKPVTCPDSAKIGTAIATSPLLGSRDPQTGETNGAEPIPGDVYLLAPHPGDLPIGGGNQEGKFRLLIQLENPRYGVNIKLPGVATADPNTGQLTTVFTDNPQLPSKHITVNLKSGPRAPLVTPTTCGKYDTAANLVPWGTPGVSDADKSASFNVNSGPGGSACANVPAQRPFAPALVTASTENDLAGASSPFTLKLTRNDGEGELSSLQATLPKGLAAKFVGIPHCSDAALAAAATRTGKAEQANPSCPASRIGSVTVGAGPGPNPLYTQGTAYLSGPYKGAPMSVAVITPAVAGPFDLGTVVVRNALYVDPETAQGRVVSDPFPKMLDGIPLKLRSILVRLDRPSFTLNPTNCSQMAVNATIHSTDGASSSPSVPFQVAGCKALGFKPDLALHLLNGPARNRHPALRAVLRAGSGKAAIAAVTLTLPAGELLDLRRLPAPCARRLPPERCPPSSRLGQARVWSPLLAEPLEGPIYMREPSGRFPDLLADLRGAGLHFVLHGRTSAPPGRLRIHLPEIPDIPLAKAQFTLAGGRRGVIVNSEALCGRSRRATASISAHNGDLIRLRPPLRLRGRC